jgi:hypothetical protein
MDMDKTPNEKKPDSVGFPDVLELLDNNNTGTMSDVEELKKFFQLTGSSIIYCLSAVFTAYGIARLMGPVLSEGETFLDALPCIITLHVYELALLGVLVLIVWKKVVDDAISVAILMALFLIATSIAVGSVADKDISLSLLVGLISVTLAVFKFFSMRRFAGIQFKVLSLTGLFIVIICNYLGPVVLARSVSVAPSDESSRKVLWMYIWLAMLIGVIFVLIEALRGQVREQTEKQEQIPFLHRPVMVYVFALVLTIGSSIHQYSMAFTFALERVIGDFVPVVLVASLLLIEILRHYGRRFGALEIVISCVPLVTMLVAIEEKSVLASGQFGLGLICYPPVFLGLCGIAIGAIAIYHRWYRLLYVVCIYGLGIILTAGFNPEQAHDLNTGVCIASVAFALLIYGIIIRNQFVCISGIIFICAGLSLWDAFSNFTSSCQITGPGGIAGVFGLGSVALFLLFGSRLHKAIRVIGILCLAGFVFDYLSEQVLWRYLFVLFGTGLLMTVLWFRIRDILVISILWIPLLVRLFIISKRIAYWRFVIVGFLLLGAGTILSLLKHSSKNKIGAEEPERDGG